MILTLTKPCFCNVHRNYTISNLGLFAKAIILIILVVSAQHYDYNIFKSLFLCSDKMILEEKIIFKKAIALTLAIFTTLVMSAMSFATDSESIEEQIEYYNIDILNASVPVPIGVLQHAAKLDPTNHDLNRFVNTRNNSDENVVMSSEEIFTLLVFSLIPTERAEYLAGYKNQELEISYENGSFYVVG